MNAHIDRVSLSGIKSCRGDEGDCFSAAIRIDGKPAGEVYYDGNGGSYNYLFESEILNGLFDKIVQAWATENDEDFEPADALINRLLEGIKREKAVRKMLKKGYPVVIAVQLNPLQRENGKTIYLEEEVVGLKSEKDVSRYLKEHGNPPHEVLSGIGQRGP